jgi:GTP cyclohydrolase I
MISEEQAKQNIRELIEFIGDDPCRVGLQDTPDRIVRMFKEMFRGYDPAQKPVITTFPNGQDGIVYDSMIVDSGTFYSVCEHHCRTFFGDYWFAYIPNRKGKILGLSKIGRAIDYCSSRMQVQERLVHDVVAMLSEALDGEYPPLGMALMMRARHMCKESRGVRKPGYMTSTYLTGLFQTNSRVRAEFLSYTKE